MVSSKTFAKEFFDEMKVPGSVRLETTPISLLKDSRFEPVHFGCENTFFAAKNAFPIRNPFARMGNTHKKPFGSVRRPFGLLFLDSSLIRCCSSFTGMACRYTYVSDELLKYDLSLKSHQFIIILGD